MHASISQYKCFYVHLLLYRYVYTYTNTRTYQRLLQITGTIVCWFNKLTFISNWQHSKIGKHTNSHIYMYMYIYILASTCWYVCLCTLMHLEPNWCDNFKTCFKVAFLLLFLCSKFARNYFYFYFCAHCTTLCFAIFLYFQLFSFVFFSPLFLLLLTFN